MHNVPTYTEFGLHRVPRTDHCRKWRTPCMEEKTTDTTHFSNPVSTVSAVVDMMGFAAKRCS